MPDQSIAEFANRIAQHQPGRLLALVAATWLLAVPLLVLLWLAVGAMASFGLHQLVDHLYFRPRPYWALPAVHAIGARRGDSSFFSLEAAVAAALACGLLLAARRWRPTRARVYGEVTYVNRELDGDVHGVLKAPDGAFGVLEIIPELPIRAP